MKKTFIGYEEIEHEVREVYESDTGRQKVINKPQSQEYRFVKRIKLNNNNGLITTKINHWQGEELPFEPIKIKLSGDIEEQIIELDEDGIQLEGTVLNIIVESIEERMVNDVIEVVL